MGAFAQSQPQVEGTRAKPSEVQPPYPSSFIVQSSVNFQAFAPYH